MAWVRPKHPKRKPKQIEIDPTETLRGALTYFSCTPNRSVSSPIQTSRFLKEQIHVYEPSKKPSKHHRMDEDTDQHMTYHEEEDYDRVEQHATNYPRGDHVRTEQRKRDDYERDFSPEPIMPRPRYTSSDLQSRPYRQQMSRDTRRTMSSKWSSAATPLPGLS